MQIHYTAQRELAPARNFRPKDHGAETRMGNYTMISAEICGNNGIISLVDYIG